MNGYPLAYFITFSTYGTWLHGQAKGSVDRTHNVPGTPFVVGNTEELESERLKMNQPEYVLDQPRREVVCSTILEVGRHRGWKIWTIHVRSNHVHVVVTADAKPEKVSADFKAWSSRRLREAFDEDPKRDRWTQHGSMLYLWKEDDVHSKIHYTLFEQGAPMSSFDGRTTPSEPEA